MNKKGSYPHTESNEDCKSLEKTLFWAQQSFLIYNNII